MLNYVYNILLDRVLKIEKEFPLEVQDYTLNYGEVYYDNFSIRCILGSNKILSIFVPHSNYSVNSIICQSYLPVCGCEYKVDTKNRLVSIDDTRRRLLNKKAIRFLCKVCGYTSKNKYQLLVPNF